MTLHSDGQRALLPTEPMYPRKRNDVKGMWKCSSVAEREAALKMANEGVPIKNIAIALGRSAPTITAWCKAGGWKRCKVERPPVVVAIEIGDAPQAPEDGDGAVYFLAAEDVDRVKVGFTRDRTTITRRMSALAYSSPVTVTLMKVIAGSMQGEKWLHAKWAEHRHHGEWFTLSAIRADIEAMESVRDVSAEVEAAKSCAACGVYRRHAKRGETMCRACAGKAMREKRFPPYVPVPRSCVACDAPMKPLSRAALAKGYKGKPTCHSCGMRAAWDRDDFAAKMAERDAKKRRKCLHCGEDGLSNGAKYHAKCWEAVAATR